MNSTLEMRDKIEELEKRLEMLEKKHEAMAFALEHTFSRIGDDLMEFDDRISDLECGDCELQDECENFAGWMGDPIEELEEIFNLDNYRKDKKNDN